MLYSAGLKFFDSFILVDPSSFCVRIIFVVHLLWKILPPGKANFGIIYHRVVWPLHGWTDLISWLASLVPTERQNSLLKMLHFKLHFNEVYGPSRGERVKIIVRCKTYLIRFKVRVVNNYVTCVSVSCHNICAIKFVFIFLDRNTNTNISWIFPNKLREMACLLSSFFRIKFVFWIADFTIPRM